MSKTLLIAKREYLSVIRKPSFWLATLAFPALILGLSFISGYSSHRAEQKIKEEVKSAKRILVLDEANIIDDSVYESQFERVDNFETALAEIKEENADALYVIPADFTQTLIMEIHAPDESLITRQKFNYPAASLVKQSILQRIGNEELITLFNSEISVKNFTYADGELVESRLEDFVVPALSVILYFLLIISSSNFLLMSVSEEKESRILEIMFSIARPKEIIWGKLLGLIAVVFTQIIVYALLIAGIFTFTAENLLPIDIDWSAVKVDPMQTGLSLFYILSGFLIIATMMVGIGSAMPTYKEAQSFNGIFIMLSMLPMYFIIWIIQEPNGLIAKISSYFPLTSAMVLLGRNALGALSLTESLISLIALSLYVAAGFYIAFKLFALGSLEYSQKLSLKKILK